MAKYRAVCLDEMISLGSFPTYNQAKVKADQHHNETGDDTTVESPVKSAGEKLMNTVIQPNGIKTTDLAKAVKTTKSKLDNILSGKGLINLELASRLGKALNVAPAQILNDQSKHQLHRIRYQDRHLRNIKPLAKKKKG